MANEKELLNFAQIAETAKKSPSDLLEITDKLTAFQFNGACQFVLINFDNERAALRLKMQLRGIALILGAKPEDFKDDDDSETDDDEL